MGNWKKWGLLVLALILCQSMVAYGEAEDVAGDDWRTTGVVAAGGTIIHDGESVDVLVTISPESAAFYWDEPWQVLFDSVAFPMDIPDAEQAFAGISFDDIDGDDESDVAVSFAHENGDVTELVWIWDSVERYVFREELSAVAIGGEPYFTRNGLEISAAVEMGTFLLENGVCNYANLGEGYAIGDCYWEVTKSGDYTHNGIRELHMDAICYIPGESIPSFTGDYITNIDSELYDFYTGMWLTTATTYNNSGRGDNSYLHTVEWQGNSYQIEFAYSTDWQYNVGDWAMVFTKSYVIYIPEDYDGLIFAAEAQPGNYRDSAKRMQMDSIAPEASILEIDTVNPYANLYFNLCR